MGIFEIIRNLFSRKRVDPEIESFTPAPGIPGQINAPEPQKPEPAPVTTPPVTAPPAPSQAPAGLPGWDTPRKAFKSTRMLADEMGLTVDQKNILCACIYQESRFKNYVSPGVPTMNKNRRKDGTVSSVDYGIVQVNDFYHIGPGKTFPSLQFVLENPEKLVRWMIRCYKAGELWLWSSYKFGHYKQWLAAGSPMWDLRS